MSVSDYNQDVLGKLRASVLVFGSEDMDLDQIQAELQSSFSLLENDGSGAADVVRMAEADIEEIRFTRLLGEQRPAVLSRLMKLLKSLPRDDTSDEDRHA